MRAAQVGIGPQQEPENTVKIALEMLGAMKTPLGQGPVEVEVPDGATVERFIMEKISYAPVHVDMIAYYIDGKESKPSAALTLGWRMKVLMIIGGG